MKRWLPVVLTILIAVILPVAIAHADELTDTTNALIQKQSDLQKAKKALEDARNQVQSLSGNLPSLQTSLNIAIAEVNVKEAQLNEAIATLNQQESLLKQQKIDREARVGSLYKQLKKDKISPVLALLDSSDFRTWTKLVSYHQMSLEDDRTRIINLDKQVAGLSAQRTKLQSEAASLRTQKAQLQSRVDSLRRQIVNARYRQSTVNSQIASLNKDIRGLSEKQEKILAEKAAANAVSTTIGNAPPVSSPPAPPKFSGSAFAFASYGVPHRVGMNQYGAKGRAEAGQNYQQILKAYYGGVSVAAYPVPATITVNGYSPEYNQTFNNESFPFEEYVKRLYEMPSSWHMEALKAQAVAARTYAVKWLNDHPGQAICPSQSCQVVKHELNTTRWQQAVDATAGIVITHGGNPISAWFSSTDGGYTQSSAQVWGGSTPYTQVVRDYAGSWPGGAYDKESPWFHKAWGEANGSPWLSKAEMLQLFNAAIKYQQTNNASSIDADLSTFTSPLSDFADVAITRNDSTGQTDAVIVIGTNQGTVSIAGKAVRAAVNLKAPGTIMLQTTLFDIIRP
jgi:SpoIID/LytB domain protein